VYRSWELDKGQILQCTGAGNWTKVRCYSAQKLGTGQKSDITVHRSWELDKGQILQLASENRSYLGEFEAEFKKALARESWEQGVLFNEKNRRSKISWHCPFNKNVSYT
jgi:hypothetical protein